MELRCANFFCERFLFHENATIIFCMQDYSFSFDNGLKYEPDMFLAHFASVTH